MPEGLFRRTPRLEHSAVSAYYHTVVKVLQSIHFYDQRNERHAAIISDLLGPSLLGARVALDLGCGPGNMTARLPAARLLVGIDSDRFSLVHSIEPKTLRIQALAERLPIRTGSVTIAVAISLVEHIADHAAFFQEVARILEPNGCAVLQIPELRYPVELHTKWPVLYVWRSSIRNRVLAATGYEDLNMSTSLEGTIRLAEKAGLDLSRVIPVWHFRLARLAGVPMGYFILLRKSGHEINRRDTRGPFGGS